MMYEDLTQYAYLLDHPLRDVLNIGWIGQGQEFKTGVVPEGFINSLDALIRSDNLKSNFRVNIIRGVHPCNVCGERKFQNAYVGSCEIWIPSARNGIVYAAPSMILHYIETHGYLPPQEFIDAVGAAASVEFNAQQYYDDAAEVEN